MLTSLSEVDMASGFERAHHADLCGSLTMVDRLIIRGHLSRLWFPNHMAYFLDRLGVHIVQDFARFMKEASSRVVAHAEAIAKKAGRPFIYQDRVVKGKDDLAHEVAKRDGVREGLICVFSTVEPAMCFALAGGAIRPRLRKCLHLYFYVMDRELGFIHIRLQTWFPFQIQIYMNGHEYLARQLERRGVGFERYQNTFLSIADLPLAQRLCASFVKRRWIRLFDAFARRVNPWLPVIRKLHFGSYYWCIDACEVSTDLMWRDRRSLVGVLDDLFDYALRAFSADDVVRFLGLKCRPQTGDLETRHARRPEGRRIKHRIRQNWLKLYDKWSVLRVETVINNPSDFRVLRFETDRRGRRSGRWMRMNKGIYNLWRHVQIGEATNRRYLTPSPRSSPPGPPSHISTPSATNASGLATTSPVSILSLTPTPSYSRLFSPVAISSPDSPTMTSSSNFGPHRPPTSHRLVPVAAESADSSPSFADTRSWQRSRDADDTASRSSGAAFSPQHSTTATGAFLKLSPLEHSPGLGHSGEHNH
jgi:hypothetical protein